MSDRSIVKKIIGIDPLISDLQFEINNATIYKIQQINRSATVRMMVINSLFRLTIKTSIEINIVRGRK